MNPFNKLLLVPLVALAIGGGVGIAAATNGGSSPAPASPPQADVKGPCDELEHATDPSCAGAQVPEDNQAAGRADHHRGRGSDDPAQAENQGDDNGQDADDANEVENENEDVDDDNAEDVDDDQAEEQDEENSGPSDNSGPGSENSGHGSDDGGDSGHGGGDD